MLEKVHADWLASRGIDLEVATRYGLCTKELRPGGRALAFPFVRRGKTVNHKYRLPGKEFRQDKGSVRALWNEDVLADRTLASEPLVIVEGEMDALSAIQAGYLRTVSVPDGAGSNLDFLTAAELWPLLRDVPTVILATDGDEPGQTLQAELARRLGAARCHHVDYPKGTKDLNEVLLKGGPTGVREVLNRAKPYPVKGLYRLSDYPDVPNPITFETGFISLNPIMRLWRGEFMVVTGVPSTGKSLFTLQLLASVCEKHNHRAAIASFEMAITPYVRDVLRDFHGGETSKADEWIEEAFVFIDQDPREEEEEATIEWILDRASDAVVRHGIDWLLIDPWNQIDHQLNRGEGGADYQRRAIKAVKRFARSYQCGVIVVAHPTKDVRDAKSGKIRMPNLYDIDGSAHWFNAADHGVVIDRPLGATSTLTKVVVPKVRFRSGGTPGEAWLEYDPKERRLKSSFAPSDEGPEV